MSASIQPCHASSHHHHLQLPALQVHLIYIRDLQFAAGGRLQRAGNLHHIVVVEIEPGHCISRLGLLRLLLQSDSLSRAIELDHAITFWIVHRISENPRSLCLLCRLPEVFCKVMTIENVVTQDQCPATRADKVTSYDESLRDSLGLFLD